MIGYDGFKHRKGSKIHACVDEYSMPLSIALGAGNEHDSKRIDELLDGLGEAPKELYADSAYDTEAIRGRLSSMNVEANIPVNPRNGRKPIQCDIETYGKMRSAVERFYGWLKSFRRIIVRYGRLAAIYKALITIAYITIHLRYRI